MEFRAMRRDKQQLSQEECEEILTKSSHGILAVSGDGGYPYTVPLSFYYEKGAIYIHCAKAGHKIDAIKACGKASFCIVYKDEVVAQEFTTYYKSVVAFGIAELLTSEEEILYSVEKLAEKYAPQSSKESRIEYIRRSLPAMSVIKINIEQVTGKQAVELTKKQ